MVRRALGVNYSKVKGIKKERGWRKKRFAFSNQSTNRMADHLIKIIIQLESKARGSRGKNRPANASRDGLGARA